MAGYRNIMTSFWTDSKVDDDFTPEDKYFYLYLMTNPHTSLCGCYEISMKQMERETGYNTDTVKRLIQRMQEMHNVIRYSSETKEVLLVNWWKYNWSSSKKVESAVRSVAEHIKHGPFKKYVMDMVSIRYRYGMHTTDTDTVSDTESESDTDTDTVSETEYRITETENRVCGDARQSRAAHTPIAENVENSETEFETLEGFPLVKITKDELRQLRNLDLSATKRTLASYFAVLTVQLNKGKQYKSHFDILRKWAMEDGAKVSNSSIDMGMLAELANKF